MPIAVLRSAAAVAEIGPAAPVWLVMMLRRAWSSAVPSPFRHPGLEPGSIVVQRAKRRSGPRLKAGVTDGVGASGAPVHDTPLRQRPIQRCQQPFDVAVVVVVGEADAHDAVVVRSAERLDQARGPEIAVADGDLLGVQLARRCRPRLAAGHVKGDHRRQRDRRSLGRRPTIRTPGRALRRRSTLSASRASCATISAIDAPQPRVEGIGRLQLVMGVQGVEIIGHADAAGGEFVIGAAGQELVGDVVVGDEEVVLVGGALQDARACRTAPTDAARTPCRG